MKIGVTGYKGHVGQALINLGAIPLKCDVRDIDSIRKAVKDVSPDIVVNAASKTSPTWCAESQENYWEALDVNVDGLKYVSVVCKNIPVIALSTDHVFPGKNGFDFRSMLRLSKGPYKEDDNPFPVNDYGLTKVGTEFVASTLTNVKVIRTSNLFWDKDPRVLWYLDEAYKKDKVKVPVFQKRSFMHVYHFADGLLTYMKNFYNMPKMLHISGSITVDWYTFMLKFCDAADFPLKHKFVKKCFDDRSMVKRPKSAGLDVSMSKELRLPQYSYIDGMELLK